MLARVRLCSPVFLRIMGNMSAEKIPLRELAKTQPSKPYHVGVLFVHGIGSQARGNTVIEFGEGLHTWLENWLGGR